MKAYTDIAPIGLEIDEEVEHSLRVRTHGAAWAAVAFAALVAMIAL